MLPSFKNKKGFTLIEIMIVILVMGILAVAAITSYVNSTDTFSFISGYKQVIASLRTARSYALTNKETNGVIPDRYVVEINTDSVKTYADTGAIPLKYDTGEFIIKNYTLSNYTLTPQYARTHTSITFLPVFISYQTRTGEVTIMDNDGDIIDKGENKYISILMNEGTEREKYIVLFQVSGLPEEFDNITDASQLRL